MAGKKTGKRLLTWVLVLVMALSLLPVNALAKPNGKHNVKVNFAVLYIDDSFYLGYNYKTYERNTELVCQDNYCNPNGYNHSIKISDIKAAAARASIDSGYEVVGWAKEASTNPQIWSLDHSGNTYVSKSNYYIYIVAKKPAPITKYTYTLAYDANGGTGAPSADSWSTTDSAIRTHTFDIKNTVPTREGYVFKGWKANDGSDTIYHSDSTKGTTTCAVSQYGNDVVPNGNTWTRTLYAVWGEDAPVDPAKPSEEDIKNLLVENVVKVDCINSSVVHADETYSLLDGSFSVGDVQGSAGSYTCTVTVNAAKYVDEYNKTISGHSLSTTDTTPKSITLAYAGTKWVAQTATPIVFKVVCDATPADPKVGENFDFDKNIVDVICETTSDHNYSYGLKNGYYTVSDKKQLANGNWQCKITIDLAKYFDLYKSQHSGHTRDMDHSDAFAFMMIYPTWYADSGNWIFVGTGAAEIYVKCDAVTPPTEPSGEDVKELLGSNAVQIICTNVESGHGSKTFGLIDGTFSIVHSGYNCEVKIDSFNEYVEEFNTELNVAQGTHFSDTSKADQSIINLRWVNGAWTAVDTPAKHHVLCVTPKYTVTYTDGVGEEVFKDQVYTNLRKGADTPAFDGGTPTRKGYNFTNWLPAVAETVTDNATYTAQWEKDDSQWFTVKYDANGGTGTVTDSKEYLSDDTVTVKGGNSLKKDGYDFTGWNTKKDGTGDTYAENDEFNITGNTTLYAQWKAKEYSFTVNYLWDNTPIPNIPSTTGSDALGTEVIPNTDIDGYTLISGQPTSMTIGAGENVLNLNYYKNVTLTANSDSATYDGTEHTVTGYTAKDNENKAVEGLTFTGVASPSVSGTDVGEYDVTFSANAKKAISTDKLYTVTDTVNGKLEITPRKVTLTSASASKVYDGTALTKPNVTVGGDGFADGEGATYNVTGTITNVGTTDNTFTYTLKDGTKATNYTITKKEGKLTITEASAPTPGTFDFNDVVPDDGKVTPAITKTVKGNVGKNFTEAFYVTVKGADETSKDTMSAASYTGEAKVTYSDLKDIAFLFAKNDKLTFHDAGSYTYTVREIPGKTSRMSYDTTEYTLTIKVVLNKNTNKYEVESWQFPVGNREYPTLLNIVNTYRTYHPSTPSKPTLNTGDHYAYVMGYPDGTVRPNGSITRAEVSAILFRLLSDKTRDEYFTTESSFTDVKAGAWYNNSIATLEKAGVIVDTAKGGAFRPNEAITRAELAAMLAQFSDAKPVKGVKFSDVSAEHWAYEAIAIAAKMGWIEGYPDGTFRPDATITRAEMMTLVNRALERVPSDEDHLLSKRVMLTFPDCKSGDWFYIAVQEATNSHTYERAATEKNGDEQWTALRANRDWTQLEK